MCFVPISVCIGRSVLKLENHVGMIIKGIASTRKYVDSLYCNDVTYSGFEGDWKLGKVIVH